MVVNVELDTLARDIWSIMLQQDAATTRIYDTFS